MDSVTPEIAFDYREVLMPTDFSNLIPEIKTPELKETANNLKRHIDDFETLIAVIPGLIKHTSNVQRAYCYAASKQGDELKLETKEQMEVIQRDADEYLRKNAIDNAHISTAVILNASSEYLNYAIYKYPAIVPGIQLFLKSQIVASWTILEMFSIRIYLESQGIRKSKLSKKLTERDGIDDIRKAYCKFDNCNINDLLSGSQIENLITVRKAIVHNAGTPQPQHITLLSKDLKAEVGKPLNISSKKYGELYQLSLGTTIKLLIAVDEWLVSNPAQN